MSKYDYVRADQFTPESRVNWKTLGNVTKWKKDEEGIVDRITLSLDSGHTLYIYFLSHQTFRVRFNPDPNAPYVLTVSPATVEDRIEAYDLHVEEVDGVLRMTTNFMQVRVNLARYALSVYRGEQLIHADPPDYNLVYIPRDLGEAVANFKMAPTCARYYGFGEKGGASLDKRRVPKQHFYGQFGGKIYEKIPSAMTFFNFDNFGYDVPDLTPEGERQGPLNPNEPLYQSSPFIIEHNPTPSGKFAGDAYAYGILMDNTSQTYMNLRQGDQYYFGALYGELDYYFIAGNHVANVLNEFTYLTGRTLLKPKYVFGYHQGGYGPNYNNKWNLLQVALQYREAKIPCDGIHVDVDFQNNYRTFTYSPKKFPNPKGFFDSLHDWGYKVCTNITPIVSSNVDEDGKYSPYKALDSGEALNMFVINQREGQPPALDANGNDKFFIGNVNYGRGHLTWGHYADLGRADVQKWWGDQYKDLLDWGLDFVWQDMTIPAMKASVDQDPCPFLSFPMDLMLSDNEETRYAEKVTTIGKKPFAKIRCLYNYNLCKATHKGLDRLRGDRRNFIIARGGFVGVHRHAALWTGDSTSDWQFVRINIPMVLTIGLSGQPVSGCDIGGFAAAYTNQIVDPELLSRWTILGAFLPWFRNHYDNYSKAFQEPFRYAEPVPTICRKHIELRYRLIQLIYDAMYENTRTGKPIVRPLFMDETQPGVFNYDAACHDDHAWGFVDGYVANRLDDQHFLGRDMLICPIVNPGQTQRPVYLPAGSFWYNFKDNKYPLDAPVKGGVEFSFYAPWDKPEMQNLAIYVREGAIIPMRELEQYIGELYSQGKENPITFCVYPGRDNKYTLYLDDDGVTRDAETKQAYRVTEITHEGITSGQRVSVKRVHDKYKPRETFYFVALLGTTAPKSVKIEGKEIPSKTGQGDEKEADALASSTVDAYYHNDNIKTTYIKIFDVRADVTIEAKF